MIYVIGSGMTGASSARVLADRGNSVFVIEKKDVVSGNMYDPILSSGYRIHKYGPHAFHTNSKKVFNFLSRFTKWKNYEHKVLANVNEHMIPIPYNFNSLKIMWPGRYNQIIEYLSSKYKDNEHVPILKLMNSKDNIERELADHVYNVVFLEYTKKQWGMKPEEIGASVTSRLPIRMGYDDRYFLDKYQGIPSNGYLEMVENMLDHQNISIIKNHKFYIDDINNKDTYIYTGPIDELLNFKFGILPYRSLSFIFDRYDSNKELDAAQVNFTVSENYTRKTDYSVMLNQSLGETYVGREYSTEYVFGLNEPYYPIPKNGPRKIHKQYVNYLKNNYPNVILAGRLADYRYYNMDQACARGIQVAESMI